MGKVEDMRRTLEMRRNEQIVELLLEHGAGIIQRGAATIFAGERLIFWRRSIIIGNRLLFDAVAVGPPFVK